MSRPALFLLGPPRIERDGEPIEIGRRKAIALIAYLAVTRQVHSRDALGTLFWPEYDQSRARAGLRRVLASLKKSLGEGWLDVDRESVGLNREAELWLDVAEFQERLAACGAHDHPAEEVCPDCLPLLVEAAELYRDDFLAGFTLRDSPAFDEWQFFQSQGLRADLAGGLERLARELSQQGEYQPAIAYARRWLALDPLHEPAHRCLMAFYARSDQRAAALRQYQACERVLQEELGVPPQAETSRLYQAIKGHREGTPAESQPERYRLERKLSSEGSFGDLWLATDTLLERPVAVKCPKGAHDPHLRERFLTEARMLARLNHPNITQIHDALFDEGQDRFYLVMEYVDGKDLAEIIRGGTPLPLDWVLDVAGGILQALRYAHKQGVVHRDVKPDNIMIADDVKLTDFGLADLRSILEQGTRFLAGTPAYMAPEQIEGRATDGRADLYALGVILFEMLSGGRLPFEHEDRVEMLSAHLHADPPPISQFAPTVPTMLEQVIMRLLAKDPDERYPSAEAVMEALDSTHAGPLPAFLEGEVEREETEAPVFVARQRELAQLDEHLAAALEGQGRVMFVTGEAGRGKTALLHEFARRAQATHPELMVASGHCSAYTGVGDPYLPFRDVMGMLSGDVERAWAAGAITREHACRLWSLTPHTAQALADDGPDLIDVFVSGSGLVRRATAGAPGGGSWLSRLQDLAERERAGPGDLEQPQLFEQYTQVLRSLAAGNPLLLTLDDLQWADTASTNLLFHLGRRLEGSRILVLGAYRPSEVALGRPSGDMGEERQHPLEPVITELKRIFGDIHLDLGQVPPAEGREFVDAFLDTEPHRLGEEFRQALFRHTGGHPLFTVELLRGMQERGDLIQDEAGRWIVGPALAWEALPARVEAVIEGRIGRLKGELREILTVASVEGEDFTAQVVARVQAIGERRLLRQLSQELEKRHRLVRELGEVTVGCQRLSRYRFGHVLFQQHLYNGLSLGERRLLHGEIAKLLEELYQGCTDQIAVQLARHYVEAGQVENAADYLLRSGNQARRLYANDEALRYYQQVEDYLTHLSLEDHWPSALQMHLKRSALHRLNGDYELAEYDLTCALELAQTYQDTRAEAEAYSLLADLRHYEMRNEESLAAARRAHTIATTHHHLPELNTSLVQLGIACDMLGDVERSMVYLGQAQELAEERGDQLTVARVLNTMAVTW
jgi:DNA-binding SARP family transcriptional activator/predicted ATPase